ncbi:DUF7619 domain-containing protein [Sanyastnella coralliicola]|uniref:T9SS type A sorting domain-containing protein n=1 Tax=Sanyastnella coralliicola TaxID=3069118 RepID=UPI0027BA5958|nr:T9SS type A sorting domain-containing protein [Longitalea sp. SCSIO 12813]
MKKLLTYIALLTSLTMQAQLNEIVVEEYPLLGDVSIQPEGTTTYRIYAEMGSATDVVNAVFATEDCHSLDVSTTTSFYNEVQSGEVLGADINAFLHGIFPLLEADTWVTIGATNHLEPGASDVGYASLDPEGAFISSFDTPDGQNLILDNGAWFTLPTSVTALPSGPYNRVLLGQFTTDGQLSFNLNIQIFAGGDQANGRIDYVHSLPCEGNGTPTGFEVLSSTLSQIHGLAMCNDAEACNYSEEALNDLGCCYDCTCTDPNASNYGGDVGCDNNSVCTYDINGNLHDDIYDLPLEGVEMTIEPLGVNATSNSNGDFVFYDVPYGLFTLNFASEELANTLVSETSSSLALDVVESIPTLQYNFESLAGCNDPSACNYDAMDQNDIWCCFECGCSDPDAVNYSEDGTCTNPSVCLYDIEGTLLEPVQNDPLENQEVILQPIGITAITDENGVFEFSNVPFGIYNIEFGNPELIEAFVPMISSSLEIVVQGGTEDLEYRFELVPGCNDLSACVYMPGTTNDYLCCYDCTCTDPLASNYGGVIGCDNPTVCTYDIPVNILSTINGGGIPEVAFNIEPGGIQGITDNNGTAVLSDLSYGTYQIQFVDQSLMEFFNENYSSALEFTVTNEIVTGLTYQFDIPLGCTDPTSCSYSEEALIDNGTCIYLCGCLDEAACNYLENPEMIVPCEYESCPNPNACNYDPNFTCPNEDLCELQGRINIQVFHDEDADGVFVGGYDNFFIFWFEEPVISNVQVTIEELGWVGFTNSLGQVQFDQLPFGEYTISVEMSENWQNTTPETFTVEIDNCEDNLLHFGYDWLGEEVASVEDASVLWFGIIHCENGHDPGFEVTNYGGVPFSGTVTLTFDPVLTAVPFGGEAIDPTAINPGEVIWEFTDQLPGSQETYKCLIESPGLEYLDETFDVVMHAQLYDSEGIEFYNIVATNPLTVACAYDPNDKYTEFEGYTEEHHFILPEDEMEYRIRFQNTGNFPAGDVIIRDTLDIEHLDLDTFSPSFGSHDFTTIVKPDGAVEFIFSDIQLPDSTCCEQESHGYVVYRITPRDDVEPGDVINNTAYIFFDGNPPIVTNTTWHTIYECTDELAAYELASDTQCQDQLIQFNSTGQYIEDYYWSQDGQTDGVESTYFIMPEESGDINIGLMAANPLCEAEYSSVITIHPTPAIDAGLDQTVCPEEPVTFLATGDGDLQWDGQDMGASLDIIASAESEYNVTATTEFGCVATDQVSLFLHPEPVASFMANGNLLTYDGDAGINYQWYLNNEMIDGATSETYEVLEDGNYAVEVTNEFGCSDISDEDFIVYSGIEESDLWNIQVYPNPNDGMLHISMEQQGSFNLQIIDNSGNLVHQQAFQTTKLDVNTSKLASGIYTLRICHEDGSVCLNRRITKR